MRVAVVGCGAAGAAATHSLAREGHDVLALDRFGVPNGVGSSHGRSRIFRLAYHEGETYVPLLRRSLDAWRALDRARGRPGALFRRTGSLAVGPPESEVVTGARETCETHELDHEVLSGAEVGERFPAWHLDEGYHAVFQPDGGLLDPERCLTALVDGARTAGASVRGNVRVESVRETGDGVRVASSEGTHEVDRAVVAAGPWTADLVPALDDLLTVTRHVHCRVGTPDSDLVAPDALPVFVLDALDGAQFYGLPAHRVPGVKVGRTDTDETVAAPHPLDSPAPDESGSVERFVDECLGGSTGVLAAAACPITNSPDGDYLVDHAPGSDRVVVAAGLSGHGFKTAPAVGELAAALAVESAPPVDPDPFRLSRF
ncbi:MAG: N-methyl-L-tryptophan oxidase [Haloferacaceae archaeon]